MCWVMMSLKVDTPSRLLTIDGDDEGGDSASDED